ncbi:30S ribosomal protein S16 [Mycoplasmopsis canis UFG4]|uniref:Small ribosomal subunit protein bS16 n=2 Tax=Mycoplasmopsis canis TaxID=29555 RepID=I1A7G9_9BACT|nr:30S ribosomal protein S16 [Mycoplasmopsis canis]AKF40845.1 30S ribosomal protein S16 [Mycoplasmopsis canis]AMD80959.1 30S ribosomal protein S16 [Mycoplasmopsis canis PG 14]EIE41010.1 30S ribosomal protein S16 [Mycoplasmopsis canis UF31]EIE41082.1 30S ribosomal protein S16 [Mycoplasmopsis canis PG 14]EIE41134.1 30S ribosomal protein S16 [Mycoplasmopsis canis UF33]
MVKIRLRRMGSKFRPVYKIVAADARAPRDGKFIEALGHYNPNSKELVLNKELVEKWLSQGAKPTDTVANLLKKQK